MSEAKTNRPDKKLAANCGLFCPACTIFIGTTEDPERLKVLAQIQNIPVEDMKCYGCHSETRIPYCADCKMLKCAEEKGIDFCIECEEYPCEHLKSFQSEAPHRLELWESLARIKEVGYAKWFEEMNAHYACPECNALNSAYDMVCRKCGASPGSNFAALHAPAIVEFLSQFG
jgi:hypothetical protein